MGVLNLVLDKIERLNIPSNYRGISWCMVLLICFVSVFVLNLLTPLSADDFGYLFIHGKGAMKVENIGDIFESQYLHYHSWGGRSVVHFIAQALLLLPAWLIDLLNSLVYILYIGLIYLIIRGKEAKNSISLFLLINISVWVMQPAFGDTILWITGSANYLWGTTLVLLFILPYRLYNGKSRKSVSSVLLALCFLLYGLVAGWTNENTAGGMIVLVVLFMIYYRHRKWAMPLWAILGLIGAIMSYMTMILAPGNTVRAGDAGELSLFLISYRMFMHSLVLFTEHGAWILLFLVLLIIQLRETRKGDSNWLSILFFAATIVSIYVMILSPSFPPRAWFGVLSFLLIAIGLLFSDLRANRVITRPIVNIALLVGIIVFLFLFYTGFKDAYTFYSISNERQEQVDLAKQKGEKTVVFTRYISNSKFVHAEEPESNHMMSWYYDVEIEFEEKLTK